MNHLGRELVLAGASFCLGLWALVAFPGSVQAADPPFKPELDVKPVGPNDKINFQLVDAEISELVRVVGGFTGKRFVIANNKIKSIRATIVAAQPITATEAYQAFLSVLQANGLTVLERGTYFQIVESKDVERQNTAVVPNDSLPAEDRYVTQVLRLKNVRAEDVADSVLAKFQTREGSIVPYAPGNLLIMTDTGSNLRRMMRLLEEIDVPNASEDKLYFEPIHYASATDVEKKLTEIFDLKKKDMPTTDGLHITKVIAIDRPNALAIVATPESYKRLLGIVRIMDQPLSNEGQINVVPLQHVDAKKIVQSLNEAVGGAAPAAGGASGPPGAGGASGSAPKAALSVLESSVKISADESTNSILVTSSPRDFASIKTVIDKMDRPKRQVYIEAVVMEITAGNNLDFGVAWHGGDISSSGSLLYGGWRADKSALPPDATSLQAFALGLRSPDIQLPFTIPGTSINSIPGLGVLITALAHTEGADILSTPSIVASDNMPAELKVQINTPLNPNAPPASIIAGGTTIPGTTNSNANMQKIGPRVKITPHLNESDEIRLDVDEQISDIVSQPAKGDTYGSVISVERSAQTTLTVKDEETVVIAGLMKNNITKTVDKVPLLGDIPVLGALFRNTSEKVTKSNLVLVLTPHIMRDKADRVRIFEKKMEERQAMIDHAALFGGQPWTPRKDYAHARGLVGEIRKAYGETANKAALERARNRRETKTHEPQEPVEMPTPIQTWGGTSDSSPSKPPAGKPVPNVER